MKRAAVLLFFAISIHAQLASDSEPSISPGGDVAFVSGGDIWTVPLAGGEARLLVSNPASDDAHHVRRSAGQIGRAHV